MASGLCVLAAKRKRSGGGGEAAGGEDPRGALLASLSDQLGRNRDIRDLVARARKLFDKADDNAERLGAQVGALLEAAARTSAVAVEHLERISGLQLRLADSRESERALADSIADRATDAASLAGKIAAAAAVGSAVLAETQSHVPPEEPMDAESINSTTAANSLESMLADRPLATSLFRALLPRLDSLSVAESDKKTLRSWLLVASFLAFTFPQWKSRLSFILLKAMLDAAGPKGATELARKMLPGAHSFSGAERLDDIAYLQLVNQDPTFDTSKNFLVFVYDNIQKQHGKSAETGAGGAAHSTGVTVRTMRIVLVFRDDKMAALQFNYDANPARQCQKYPAGDVPQNALAVTDVVDPHNTDNMSDYQYLQEELKGSVVVALERIKADSTSVFDEKRGDERKDASGAEAKKKSFQKVCSDGCGAGNYNRHQVCTQCGKKLPKMEDQKQQNLQKTAAGGGKTAATPGHGAGVGGAKLVYQTTTKTQRLDQAQYLSPSPSYAQDSYAYEQDDQAARAGHDKVEKGADNIPVTRVVLPILDLNPGVQANQNTIGQGFLDLIGHGKQGGVLTAARCTDAGATDVRSIIRDEVNDFWVLLALGHAEMAVTRLSMKIVVAVVGLHFIYAHSFKEGTGGPDYLQSCKSNHKAWTFTQLVSEALYLELAKQYLLRVSTADDVDNLLNTSNEEELAQTIIEHYNDVKDDKMQANAWVAAKFLSACTLYRKALRDNQGSGNAFAHEAATKIVTPLLYMCGFVHYAPLLHWTFIRNRFRASPEVQQMYRKTMCINGQGLEFHIEEDIQRVVRASKGRTGKALQKAALGLNDSYHVKAKKILGVNRPIDRKWRSNIERAKDREAFNDVFCQHNSLRYVPERQEIESVDGKFKWLAGVSLKSLFDQGAARAEANKIAGFTVAVPLATKMLHAVGETGEKAALDDFAKEEEEEEAEAEAEDEDESEDES